MRNIVSFIYIAVFFITAYSYNVTWEIINPSISGENGTVTVKNIRKITYGKGRFVALSDLGVLSSTDARVWQLVDSSETGKMLEEFAFNDSIFVAVGFKGVVKSSIDGIHWILQKENLTFFSFTHVAYGKGKWITADPFDEVFTSSNLVDWTVHEVDSAGLMDNIVFHDSMFFSVGNINGGGKSRYSTDGINWKTAQKLSGWYGSLIYFKNRFVAVGDETEAAYSYDGLHWTEVNPCYVIDAINGPRVLTGGPDYIVALGSGYGLQTSADGINWTCDTFPGTIVMSDVTYGSNEFIAVGDSCTILSIKIDSIATGTGFEKTHPKNKNAFTIRQNAGRLKIFLNGHRNVPDQFIYIYAMNGKKVYSKAVKNDGALTISTNSFTPGIYSILLKSNAGFIEKSSIIILQ